MNDSNVLLSTRRFCKEVLLLCNPNNELARGKFFEADRGSPGKPQIDLIKASDGRSSVVVRQWGIVGANARDDLQADRGCCIHFGNYVGKKYNIGGTDLNRVCDSRIAARFPLGSDGGVEVLREQGGQVTLGRMSEEEFLGEDTPGRVDLEIDPSLLPSLK